MFRVVILLLLGLFNWCLPQAQPSFQYQPLQDDSSKIITAQQALLQQFQKDSMRLQKEHYQELLAIFKERYNDIRQMFDAHELVLNTEAEAYLQKLLQQIVTANPQLASVSPRLYFSRANWPNAYSTGEGTIVFNMSLFTRLQDKSQVAFVLCHELAHLYLDHSNQQIIKYINTLYSEEYQKKLKEIKNKEFEKNKLLNQLELNFAFKSRRHSREFEAAADSMALVFMKATNFDVRSAISCLALLDHIDQFEFDIEKSLMQTFQSEDYPFRKRWLQKEEVFFGGVQQNKTDSILEDSLKTHPACKDRIKILQPKIQQIQQVHPQTFPFGESAFREMQQRYWFEMTRYSFNNKSTSQSLFLSLMLLKDHPNNAFLIIQIGKCLNDLYEKQRAHELGKVCDLPSPQQEKQYNRLLEFIQRLSLTDIANLNDQFLKKYELVLKGNKDYEQERTLSKKYLSEQNK